MIASYRVTAEVDILSQFFPIPGYGAVPINAFVLKAQAPILIDTGAPLDGSGADATASFMKALCEIINLADLRWIWLTHADMDHVACVHQILEQAPQARVATSFLTLGRMSLWRPLPLDRVHLLYPGQTLDLGDRTLTSVRPPSFDAADTAGVWDSKSRLFFCADCFGAMMSKPAQSAADLPPEQLRQGQTIWATLDAPWIHSINREMLAARLDQIRRMAPELILSSHLPPADGSLLEQFLEMLTAAPAADPFVGLDQAALEQMLSAAPVG